MGYREDPNDPGWGPVLSSEWNSNSVWATAFWTPHPAIRLGLGPGWYGLKSRSALENESVLGLMGESGAEIPWDRRFFLDVAIRFHLVPETDVQVVAKGPGWIGRPGVTERVTLRPNLSHATLQLGLGLHL